MRAPAIPTFCIFGAIATEDRALGEWRRSWVALRRGFAKKCPNCGCGRLFRRWTRMVERCPCCGWKFNREEGFMLGGVAINLVATEAVFGVVLVIALILTLPDTPILKLEIIGLTLNLVFP